MPDKKAWKFSKEVHDEHVRESKIWWGVKGTNSVPALKLFLTDVRDGLIPHDWWPFEVAGHTDEAKKELDSIFDSNAPFDTPKPVRLLKRILQVGAVTDDHLVVDFFAGSGTTGHAVNVLNVADGGRRRFIMVQLPEPTDRKDYPTIAEITKERLRRAGKKIREEWEGKQKDEETRRRGEEGTLKLGTSPLHPVSSSPRPPDTGFRVFKLASSNIRAWEPDREKLAETLEASVDHLKTDRTEQDILFELLLKLGLDLTVAMESRRIEGGKEEEEKRGGGEKGRLSASSSPLPLVTSSPLLHSVHSIGAGTLLVCLSTSIPQADVEPLALGLVAWHKELKPAGETTVVFRDSAFADDVAKTNLTAILHQHGLETVRSL